MTEKTSRDPDYFGDIDKYGKFGEDLFLSMYKDKLEIEDVRKDKAFQKMDVDFICKRKNSDDIRYFRVDVKVDTRALDTGNLAYEVVSHGSCGWSVVTGAEYLFFVLAKDNPLKAVRCLWIDRYKWDAYCSNRNTAKKMNIIQSESIVDLLCKIDDLKNAGVITNVLDLDK